MNMFFKKLTHTKLAALTVLAAIAAAVSLAGCDSAIYDEEGDCDIHYRLRFSFEHNLLFRDAFTGNVNSVEVYAFDPGTGVLAWQRGESGEVLAAEGYTMSLDGVTPGTYRLVAWCGLENSRVGTQPASFTLPELTPGVSTYDDLRCRMERDIQADASHHSQADLWPLYHGVARLDRPRGQVEGDETLVTILPPDAPEADGQTITYTVQLKKNTNRVRVILQQLSGEDIDVNNFTFEITSDNGLMAHDNSLIPDSKITYHAWNKDTGVAGVGMPGLEGQFPALSKAGDEDEEFTQVRVAVADLTVGRLVVDQPMTLTITKPDGSLCARLPLVDYALLARGYYTEPGTLRPLEQQEYLDREDNYTLTFFLDRQHQWGGVSVWINEWRVVRNNVNVGS